MGVRLRIVRTVGSARMSSYRHCAIRSGMMWLGLGVCWTERGLLSDVGCCVINSLTFGFVFVMARISAGGA